MKILFVNGHRSAINTKSKFNQFYQKIQPILKTTFYYGNQYQQIIKNKDELHDILYQQNSSYLDLKCLKRFQMFDFIFLDGQANVRPWDQQMRDIMILIRMCIRYNMKYLMNGFGFIGLYYYEATKFQSNMIIGPNQNQIQINPINGQMKFNNKIIGNCGIHNKKYASKAKQFVSKNLNILEVNSIVLPTKFHSACYAKVSGHQIFKNIVFPFIYFQTASWMPNTIDYLKSHIKVLAETQNKLPLVIQLGQGLGTLTLNSQFLKMAINWIQKFDRGITQSKPMRLNRIQTAQNLKNDNQRNLSIQKLKTQQRYSVSKIRNFTNASNSSKRQNTKKSLQFDSPCIRCSGPYMSVEDMYRSKVKEGSHNYIGKKNMAYGLHMQQYEIKNYVARTPSQLPVLHKFRQVEKKKWLNKKTFIVY